VPTSPGLLTPAAGYIMGWSGFTGAPGIQGIGVGSRVKRFRMEHLGSDRIEGEYAFDVHRVALPLGIYFASAVA